jgi:hypothetical protein
MRIRGAKLDARVERVAVLRLELRVSAVRHSIRFKFVLHVASARHSIRSAVDLLPGVGSLPQGSVAWSSSAMICVSYSSLNAGARNSVA